MIRCDTYTDTRPDASPEPKYIIAVRREPTRGSSLEPKGVETNGANQFEIKAAITVPDTVQIRSGYSANAEIVLQRASKVLAVPESTIEFSGDSTFVYIMTDSVPQQKFERTQVTTGMSDGIKIEIKKGVTAQTKLRGAEKKDK